MKVKWLLLKDKKILHLELIPILLISFILYRLVNNIELISDFFKFLFSILSYFIWGFSIAFLLNPLMVFLEKRFKLKRIFSMLIVYTMLLSVVGLFSWIIVPKILNSIWELVENIPKFISLSESWLNEIIENIDSFAEYDLLPYIESSLDNLLTKVWGFIDISLGSFVSKILGFTTGIFKFIFGSLLSAYLLKDKEKFLHNNKRFIHAFFKPSKAANIIQFGQEANKIFTNFVIGKLVDSAIIGFLAFIGLLLLKAPYTLLISLIIGVTNMIPYVGPFIGMIAASLITLFQNPVNAIWVFAFIVLLQQFDGWILGPKILGDYVGLSPFWIIMAVLIGGGIFGIWGMFLGVPVMAMVKTWLNKYIENKSKLDVMVK